MIEIFGISMPEGLFYTLILASAIFYSFTIWLLLQILRKKMPTRILKAGLGQSLEEYRAKEDDIKVYWKEGILGRMHETIKTTKERIKSHWGVSNKFYLVRRDFNLTIPFIKEMKTEDLKLLNLTEEDENLIREFSGKNPFPIQKLSNKAKKQIQVFETEPLNLCDDCLKNVPEYITVNFLESDELKGSSTEATSQRRNEDFVTLAVKQLRKMAKGDFLIHLFLGLSIGSLITFVILLISQVIKIT